jgi:hypothetical protein
MAGYPENAEVFYVEYTVEGRQHVAPPNGEYITRDAAEELAASLEEQGATDVFVQYFDPFERDTLD